MVVGRSTRAESVEHLLHLGPRFPRARRESGHDRQESVAGQSLKVKVGGRPNRGRTWHPAQQRDLTEPIPWTERGDQMTISDYIDRASFDHVEPVAGITLVKHRLAGWQMDSFQAPGELFDGR